MAWPAFAFSGHTVSLASEVDFEGWRRAAREFAVADVPAEDVEWRIEAIFQSPPQDGREISPPLTPPHKGEGDFAGTLANPPPPCGEGLGVGVNPANQASRMNGIKSELRVPRTFIDAAETAILHSDPDRFAFLYSMLLRLKAEPNLMHIASDPDVRRLEAMTKAIRRDIHKMRAFVRFRQVDDNQYIAWFEPSHFIVERNADFFVRRFTGMRWSILTPYRSANWDGEALSFGPGANKRDVPAEDAAEELWRTYYKSIFNPARLKPKAMQAEMPKKYWRNLPETSLIPDLIRGADAAAREMIERMPSEPAPHHAKIQAKHWPTPTPSPAEEAASTIAGLRKQTDGCRRCPLWRDATQTVFGAGPETAEVVFVGEQPGDQEDIAGQPFVGPAGKVFNSILQEAEIARQKTYVTNAVKHFKFEPRGKRRIHSKPNAGEVQACRWWLDHELSVIKPKLVVALGATAAQSLLGKVVPITKMRGQVIEREDGMKIFLTIHPSFILRIREEDEKAAERKRFLADMRQVRDLMGSSAEPH
ncbi:MAG: UdgX family uracil-DNA binding protein [Rhizobiaceae bacterium]